MGRPKGSKNKPKQPTQPVEVKVETTIEKPPVAPVIVSKPPEVKVEKQVPPSEPREVDPEVAKAMKKFNQEVKADDPNLVAKWFKYLPSSASDVVW